MHQNHITKFVLHFNSESQPLVPEKEIRRVLEFIGIALICGQVDVESFDGIVNGLVTVCHGDFQIELLEIKKRIKSVLDQCERASG